MNVIVKLIKKNMESLRVKLFLTLSLTILVIITIFILFNNIVLEAYLIYMQENIMIEIYEQLNEYYDDPTRYEDTLDKLETAIIKENINIIIIGNANEIIYSTSGLFAKSFYQASDNTQDENSDVLIQTKEYKIYKQIDSKTDIIYLQMEGRLNNGFKVYIRVPINSIQDNVEIVNKFLYLIGIITILISIVIIVFISNVISKPIIELRLITKKMKDLDFSQRFDEPETKDEIALLGHNINIMADSLELTIEELKAKNSDLIKDVEEKTKIDEMRTTFISDVSHELKTPIAIIQGYAEGLVSGIADDPQTQKYYAEVILDEASKMDKLVKSLLELMKLEYGKREFKNKKFNLIKLETETLEGCKKLFSDRDMEVIFDKDQKPIMVYADDFFIEQAFSNYVTNALKYAKPINGKTYVKVTNTLIDDGKKVRVAVENSSEGLSEEECQKIWTRFYKVDKSRHRSANSSGIGLSLVKAIMNNYGNDYGVKNVPGGIEFYFDLDIYHDKNKDRIKQLDKTVDNLVQTDNKIQISPDEISLSSKIIDNITQKVHTENIDQYKDEKTKRKKQIKSMLDNKINQESFTQEEYRRVIQMWKEKNIDKTIDEEGMDNIDKN